MKNLLFLGFFLFLVSDVFAQAKLDNAEIDQATAELVSLYQLNEKQAIVMKNIQERKARNLKEIAVLEQSKPTLYKKKWLAVQEGTEASIRRLLTKEQTKIYNAKKVEQRKKEAALIKDMKNSGATKEEIQQAIEDMKFKSE